MLGVDKSLADIKAPPTTYEAIRMIEARGAAMYFSGWQDQPMKWKGLSRGPIPQDWPRCGFRSGILSSGNRHASHRVNAMLNYA